MIKVPTYALYTLHCISILLSLYLCYLLLSLLWLSHVSKTTHQSKSNLHVFGKAGPLLDHGLDRLLLLLGWLSKKHSVVLEDAGKVIRVRHQFTGHVWRVEHFAEREVVAAGGKEITIRWSHFAVIFRYLVKKKVLIPIYMNERQGW